MELLAIELRHLRYFIVLAEELNYRRAAGRLHVSAPALSVQIKKLEQILNVRLLKRDTTKVSLTAPGETLLLKARALMRHAQDAVDATQQAGQGQHEHLCVGIPELVSFHFISDAINAYRQTLPQVKVALMDFATVGEQQEALEEGRLHVGFLNEACLRRMKDVEHVLMFDLPICAVMKEQHPLAYVPQLTLAEVAQYPLLATKAFSGQAEGIRDLFEAAKIKPPAIATTCKASTLFAKLAVGHGVSLMLQERLLTHIHGLALRSVQGMRVRVHAVWKTASETPQLLAFIDQLHETNARHEQSQSRPPFESKRPFTAIFGRHRR